MWDWLSKNQRCFGRRRPAECEPAIRLLYLNAGDRQASDDILKHWSRRLGMRHRTGGRSVAQCGRVSSCCRARIELFTQIRESAGIAERLVLHFTLALACAV